MISEQFRERVRAAVDLVEVVQAYVPLKQAGRIWKGLCPFHAEKTPSFTVNPERGRYHCFGCQADGDVFAFVQAMEGAGYEEAVRSLAGRFGVPADPDGGGAPSRTDGTRRLLEANRLAAEFYQEILTSRRTGQPGRDYLQGRGFTEESIASFGLGYAPDRWDAFLGYAKRREFQPEELEAAGLVRKRKDGSGCYDLFRGRVMFPIRDARGRVVALGGRILGSGDVKYLNSPESSVFSKRSLLYGLDSLLAAARAAGAAPGGGRRTGGLAAAVVEGYTDVIMAHQAGCHEVVATLGTAFTVEHAALLDNHGITRVSLVFDADAAGGQAAERSGELLAGTDLDVRVVLLPAGLDPCDLVIRQGGEALRRLLEGGVALFDFLVREALGRHGEGPAGRSRAADQLLGLVERIGDPVRRDLLFKALAEALAIEEKLLRGRWAAGRSSAALSRKTRPADAARASGRATDAGAKAPLHEKKLVRFLLHRPDLLDGVLGELTPEHLSDPVWRKALETADRLRRERGSLTVEAWLAEADEVLRAGLQDQLGEAGVPTGDIEAELLGIAREIGRKRDLALERRREIKVALADARGAGDTHRVRELMREFESFVNQSEGSIE